MWGKIMDVIVIGCGASGIAALKRLHEAGLQVLGLEAANRIGGRIFTVDFGERAVDLGAAWCEGEKNNEVFNIAKPLDLVEKEAPSHKWFVLSNGGLAPTEISTDIVNEIKNAVTNAEKNNAISIADCIRSVAKSNETLKKDVQLTNSFLEWFERSNQLGGQSDARKGKSLKGLEELMVDRETMYNWKGRGYRTILDLLLNKYPDSDKEIPVQILLNKEVESIKWKTSQPELESRNPLVHVKCKDGSLYAAKSVIITVSIGVLKERHNQLFNPPLPVEKVKTINNLQLCVLGKVYIEFVKPWWPKTPANFILLWNEEDKAKFSEEEKWITEIFGLDTVAYQPNILLAWMYGDVVEKMEKTSEEGVLAGINKLLDNVFKKQFDVTPVKAIKRTQWATDPLTRGAYAFRSVALEEDGGSAKILSEPLYYGDKFPIVCFAGEASSHHNHQAVHGAVEAGFREADRLIQSFKLLGIK